MNSHFDIFVRFFGAVHSEVVGEFTAAAGGETRVLYGGRAACRDGQILDARPVKCHLNFWFNCAGSRRIVDEPISQRRAGFQPACDGWFLEPKADRQDACPISRAGSVWFLILTLGGIGLWIYLKYRIAFYESALLLVFLLHVLLKIWFTGETCHRWIEDRRCGALELLLCAPIPVEALIRGQSLALRRQFAWPIAATFGLTLFAWLGIVEAAGRGSSSQTGRDGLLASLPVLMADFAALRWVGMWLGLTARGFNRAIAGTLIRVLGLRWLAYSLLAAAALVWVWIGHRQLPFLARPYCWLTVALGFDLMLVWSARRNFLRFLRTIAASPSDWRSAVEESRALAAGVDQPRPADPSNLGSKSRMTASSPSPPSDGGEGRREEGNLEPLEPALLPSPQRSPWGKGELQCVVSRSLDSAAATHAPRLETTIPDGSPDSSRLQRKSSRIRGWARNRKLNWAVTSMLILVLSGGGYRYWLKREIANRLSALQKAGIPTTLDELDRARPPFTNAVNAAEVLERAFSQSMPFHMLPPWVFPNLPGFGAPLANPQHWLQSSTKQAMTTALSSNETALAVVREAPSLRAGRYAQARKSGGGRAPPQFEALWTISRLLYYEILLRAEDGDIEAALSSLHRLLELGHSLDHESALGLGYMRIFSFEMAFNAMPWLLTHHFVPEPEIFFFQKELLEAGRSLDLRQALIGERCLGLEWFRSPPTLHHLIRPGGPGTWQVIGMQVRSQVRRLIGADDRDFVFYLDTMAEFTRLAEQPWPERFRRAEQLVAANPGPVHPGSPPQPLPFSSKYVFETLIVPTAILEARRRATLAGLAIERFRRRHSGRLPDKLESLIPAFISEVPADPFDGRPIRYKRLAAGYRVYSVDRDGRDNGGVEPDRNLMPMPAMLESDVTFSVER